MGSDLARASLSAELSNHNSPRDDLDRAAWNELMYEIAILISRPRYAGLSVCRDLPTYPILGYGHKDPR